MSQRRRKVMKSLNLPYTTILLVALLGMLGRGVTEMVRCPRYCMCYLNTSDNMRSVSCVARRLDSIDLSVPRRVQSLDLSNNSISILEDRGFQNLGLIEIVKLVMRHNSIRTIGLHSFAGLTYLKWVDLTANNLYQILPWTFHDNSNLKFISLSGNPLGHIIPDGPILDVPSLEVLELSNCNFAHFSQDAFMALPNLRSLDISQNQLINFEIYTLQFLYNLDELNIFKNPWPCNTNLRNLKEFLDSKSSKLIGSSCDLPRELQEIEIKPAKFEKIISVGVAYPEYDENSKSTENDDDSVEEIPKQKQTVCDFNPVEKSALIKKDDLILPPTWLILISFQLGICTTLFIGYFWTYCTMMKKKYQPLESIISVTPATPENQSAMHDPEIEVQSVENSMETISCPETPPPSYRDLFMSSVQ